MRRRSRSVRYLAAAPNLRAVSVRAHTVQLLAEGFQGGDVVVAYTETIMKCSAKLTFFNIASVLLFLFAAADLHGE